MYEIVRVVRKFAEGTVPLKTIFLKHIKMRARIQMIVDHVQIRGGKLARLTSENCAVPKISLFIFMGLLIRPDFWTDTCVLRVGTWRRNWYLIRNSVFDRAHGI